jgi:hypothetical protein
MAQQRVGGIDAADLVALVEQQRPDVLKELLQLVVETAIRAQFDEQIGAAPFERSERRRDQRNGYRERRFDTRLGSLDLVIPRPREGGFTPTGNGCNNTPTIPRDIDGRLSLVRFVCIADVTFAATQTY